MEKNANTLRESLFESMKALRDGTMDVRTAKAIADTAKVIIDSARVELDYHKLVADMDAAGIEYQPLMGIMKLGNSEDNADPT